MILENIEQKSVITAAVISEDNPNLRSMFNREFLQIEKIANQVAEITGSNKQRYLSSLFTDTKAQIIFNLIISSIHKDINYTVASLSRSAQNDANLNCSFVSEMISNEFIVTTFNTNGPFSFVTYNNTFKNLTSYR